ncbi:Cytosolic endo-beta-N-acetylglucosaminidase 1 [Raphanus sativus]|nr:Cytosolic endo-beta-N-acetylglucosaminidase 1 [Raphanus sativus]
MINIENVIDQVQIPILKTFVSHLTKAMHSSVPGSLVIWYDSVTVEGSLAWQDQLTEMNKPFFDICDGIFMNYTWKVCPFTPSMQTYETEQPPDETEQPTDVSAVLFAPGWVYETEQPPDYHTAQNKWWSLVEKSWGIVHTYPQSLPFYSDFNQGLGSHVYLQGQKPSDAPWYNVSCQNLQCEWMRRFGKRVWISKLLLE